MSVQAIDPFAVGLSCNPQISNPASESERGTYVPVIGIALSSNAQTPNFIQTYKDKEKISAADRFNRIIIGAVFLFVLLFSGTYYWQNHTLALKTAEAKRLQRKLDRYVPYVDENLILQMFNVFYSTQQTLDRYATKSEGKALLAVIARSTPANIPPMEPNRADFDGIDDEKVPADRLKSRTRESMFRRRELSSVID